mgnify:CR=1 FL=1
MATKENVTEQLLAEFKALKADDSITSERLAAFESRVRAHAQALDKVGTEGSLADAANRETARRQAKLERGALRDAGLLPGLAIRPLRERIQVRDAIAVSAQRREEVAKLIDATVAAKARYHEAARSLNKLVQSIAEDRNLGERIKFDGAERIAVDKAQMSRFLDLFGQPEPRMVSDGEVRALRQTLAKGLRLDRAA